MKSDELSNKLAAKALDSFMVLQFRLSRDALTKISSDHRSMDIGLLEKVLRALQLLESLARTGVPFIFKGGTAAMLLAPVPHRFSIDIDILLEKQQALDSHFLSICRDVGFTRYLHQDRPARGRFRKDHYKFLYDSVLTRTYEHPVLLDVVYQDNPYPILQDTRIALPFLDASSKQVTTVKTPTIEGLIGDKMTAFAPETTGIPYRRGNRDMSLEIAKQLYDIGTLFNSATSLKTIRNSFNAVASREIRNRAIEITPNEVCQDIIDTAMTVSTQGSLGNGRVKELLTGIRKMRSFVFSETYTTEKAIVHAARTAYLAGQVMNGTAAMLSHFEDPRSIADLTITDHSYTKLNKLKKTNPEAFFFWYHTIQML